MANQYVIRFKDGSSSSPLSQEELKERILKGKVLATDDVSIYPNQFALKINDYPEFEDLFDLDEKTMVSDPGRKRGAIHEEKTKIFDPNQSKNELELSTSIEKPLEALRPYEDFAEPDT